MHRHAVFLAAFLMQAQPAREAFGVVGVTGPKLRKWTKIRTFVNTPTALALSGPDNCSPVPFDEAEARGWAMIAAVFARCREQRLQSPERAEVERDSTRNRHDPNG